MRKRRVQATLNGRPCTMAELRQFVLLRDGMVCMAHRFDPSHRCEGHWPGDLFRPRHDLTLEHVTGVHGHEDVRRDDERHCVTLCYRLNGGGSSPSRELREFCRSRLRILYPDCSVDPLGVSGQTGGPPSKESP